MASPLLPVPGGDYKSTWPFKARWRDVVRDVRDVEMFIDDQQGQIIIRVCRVYNSTSGGNVSCLFIAEHSEVETAGAVERKYKTAGPGQGSGSGTR